MSIVEEHKLNEIENIELFLILNYINYEINNINETRVKIATDKMQETLS